MAGTKHILVALPAPPLVLPRRPTSRSGQDNPLPRLGRLAWLLAAFSLPVLGLATVDLVHRGDVPGSMQAAALPPPSSGVAVQTDAIPVNPAGMASRDGTRRDPKA
ncbi:hypothetical protein QO016_000483 [Methylobacterium persicinum]|uniref:Uncharacterized protein n=1 Tax=Methylobacterium persicinum TaxID=374426 RepID=A0ABU0HFA4_9HYPH|nr:hypothetical protein [Methylobacterium persicinum]GJE40013.1 hypothetical protein KHHGKMAE_4103 [Methylobacterium persicinum]